ncbi:uncharacterized protein LOC126745744 [Anthonomus grandis grandis]|uniref:uncharacterized protein LOC126745744 n=1 Tax=Anthonomus grandis grandis TaxID=2921223 RepID=UPI002165C6A7|nr:uncharacterized protein LOC126745744 [Anthonomus grandis grandis]
MWCDLWFNGAVSVVVFVGFCFEDTLSLRDVRLRVPRAVIKGKDAELLCDFDLEGEKLYSVKWYRETYEFFRYTPDDHDPIKTFPLKDINVRLHESSKNKIVLADVQRDISGKFSCEITTEMPSFFTVVETAYMQVVEIPTSEPYINGFKKRYYMDEEVFQANCTSEYSYPGANITWYINGFPVRGPQVMTRSYIVGHHLSVVSTIRHRILKKIFPNNKMKLRCSVSLYDVYQYSTEISLELGKRSKNKHPDWPPTTKAPPPSPEEEFGENEISQNSFESPDSGTILWFFTPSKAQSISSWTLLIFCALVIHYYRILS